MMLKALGVEIDPDRVVRLYNETEQKIPEFIAGIQAIAAKTIEAESRLVTLQETLTRDRETYSDTMMLMVEKISELEKQVSALVGLMTNGRMVTDSIIEVTQHGNTSN